MSLPVFQIKEYFVEDGVAEGAYFFGKVTGSGEQVPPFPTQAWQIPTGAQIKNSAKTDTQVFFPQPKKTNKKQKK